MSAPLVMLAAGGTGGHMFPAEALAAALLERGVRLAVITDRRGGAFAETLGGIERHQVRSGGIAGRGLVGRLNSMRELTLGVIQARALVHRLAPQLVVGFGGYASAPTVLAASFAPCRTLIHEQNAVLGRANRMLASRVDRIATSFEEVRQIPPKAASRIVRTGMPLRPAFIAARAVDYPRHDGSSDRTAEFNLLVLGGSQGARVFSDILPDAVATMSRPARRALRICQQCRPEDVERVRAAYAALGVQAELAAFFTDIPNRLAAAHLVIARSGASTVAEITGVGRPAILVPYPFATDDHQSANAAALDRSGGAWMIPQGDLKPERLAAQLEMLWRTPETLMAAAAQSRAAGQPDATAKLAALVCAMLDTDQNGSRQGRKGQTNGNGQKNQKGQKNQNGRKAA
jgi:UDP-N-acetylglucosamine--N-acetylmuramyl-(pentapeptide) pyrophosphoryl-undecaprenol N-acetylglucosamine transferase